MFNREHSTLNDSSRCSDPPKCFVTFRSIDHCHSSRHFKQNQISGTFAYLALIFAPVYVGFQSGSPSHAHFAHFIANTRNSCIHIEYNTAVGYILCCIHFVCNLPLIVRNTDIRFL
ncbi:MAG: hypothetical protein [Circular genetic element sp.]|nr:MAG: hypothetical protein [Circular genetic element sp.]